MVLAREFAFKGCGVVICMYKELDTKIEESLVALKQAAILAKEAGQELDGPVISKLAFATNEIWCAREYLFNLDPSLKPPFVLETEAAAAKFKSEIDEATRLHESGKSDEAIELLSIVSKKPGAEPLEGGLCGLKARFEIDRAARD